MSRRKMLMSVMLMGVVSMFTTSCVQGDLYDDLYEDTDGWFAPRTKKGKGDGNGDSYFWCSKIGADHYFMIEKTLAGSTGCVFDVLKEIIVNTNCITNKQLKDAFKDANMSTSTIDGKYFPHLLNTIKNGYYSDLEYEEIDNDNLQVGDIAFTTELSKLETEDGGAISSLSKHAFVVHSINSVHNSYCSKDRPCYIELDKCFITKGYRISIK